MIVETCDRKEELQNKIMYSISNLSTREVITNKGTCKDPEYVWTKEVTKTAYFKNKEEAKKVIDQYNLKNTIIIKNEILADKDIIDEIYSADVSKNFQSLYFIADVKNNKIFGYNEKGEVDWLNQEDSERRAYFDTRGAAEIAKNATGNINACIFEISVFDKKTFLEAQKLKNKIEKKSQILYIIENVETNEFLKNNGIWNKWESIYTHNPLTYFKTRKIAEDYKRKWILLPKEKTIIKEVDIPNNIKNLFIWDYEEEKLSEVDNKNFIGEKEIIENKNEELHPDRYGGDTPYECKKVLEEWYADNSNVNSYEGFLLGTIIKYCNRFGKKDDKLKEAKKIEVYAKFLREFEEKQNS